MFMLKKNIEGIFCKVWSLGIGKNLSFEMKGGVGICFGEGIDFFVIVERCGG